MTPLEQQLCAEHVLGRLMAVQPLKHPPKLEWRSLRVTAGLADFRTRSIILSRILLIDEDRIRLTLTHEYAHLLAFHRHGRRGTGHGKAWRQAMVDLGTEPRVRHAYPVRRNVSRTQVLYRCDSCQETFVRKRRLPLRRRYFHRGCGGAIQFVAVQTRMDTPVSNS